MRVDVFSISFMWYFFRQIQSLIIFSLSWWYQDVTNEWFHFSYKGFQESWSEMKHNLVPGTGSCFYGKTTRLPDVFDRSDEVGVWLPPSLICQK